MKLNHVIVGLVLGLTAGTVQPATFVVDASVDSHDINPGDGLAADHLNPDSARCTLRAALEEAAALMGPDTVLVPAAVERVSLRLGSLYITDNSTVLAGQGGRPRLDGVSNSINHATLIISSDSNRVSGLHFYRARGDAIVVSGSGNLLGDSTTAGRLCLTGNGLDNENAATVRLTGENATYNRVIGNLVGLEEDGTTATPNRHGVILEHGAANNLVGDTTAPFRNLISGNTGYGVIVTGSSHSNQISGNFIGTDSSGDYARGNELGGILATDKAHGNLIGADEILQGNLISGNMGHAVELRGPGVTDNTVNGNLIGTDRSGLYWLGNDGDGLRLTMGAHDNLIGGYSALSGNLISGNGGNGICLTGENVTGNLLKANWVGPTLSGYSSHGNGWIDGDGILIDQGAHTNTVGGLSEFERNVASGNFGFGLHIDGAGSDNNEVFGNFFGVNGFGSSSLGNAVGVVISGGAQNNTIGGLDVSFRNIISGNRGADFPYGAGVLIDGDGTNFNSVSANIIGLDVSGQNPRRNGVAGIIIGGGAQYNLIGGDNLSDGNIISGNGVEDPITSLAAGIHIYGPSTAYNRIVANVIGLSEDGQHIVGNRGHGVGVYAGAHDNQIGGETYYRTNQIVGSEGAGVFIAGVQTKFNLIRNNIIYENDGLGVEIRDSAQGGIYPPTIVTVGRLLSYGPRYVTGRDAPPGSRIDIYEVAWPADPSGSGEGIDYLGHTFANSNGGFTTYLPSAGARPIVLTAIATDSLNNSSEFSVNGYSPDATAVDDEFSELPHEFGLSQNYPNPFNAGTVISFSTPRAGQVCLTVYNTLGQEVCRLLDNRLSPGVHQIHWDGRNASGHAVASGVYLYRLDFDDRVALRKMILLK